MLSEQCLATDGITVVAVADGLRLGKRLRSHNHATQQIAAHLALHQWATCELRGNRLGGLAKNLREVPGELLVRE